MQLRYYEDYHLGDIIVADTYNVGKDEMVEFANKWDPQPFHTDEEAVKASIYGGLTPFCVYYGGSELPGQSY